jgi:uncharacterized coiled-coil protein SlyX
MTQEERIAQLEQENAELRAQLAAAYQQINQLAERLQRIEGQLAKDSHTSLKPPSSDGESAKAPEPASPQRESDGRATGACRAHVDASGQS